MKSVSCLPHLVEVELLVPTLAMAAALPGEPDPGVVQQGGEEVTVPADLLVREAGRVLEVLPPPDPVQLTADPPGDELHHAAGEAEAVVLLAGPGWSVEDPPLYQVEVSEGGRPQPEVDPLGLAQPQHVHTGPELVPLVQVDPEPVREVLVEPAVQVS